MPLVASATATASPCSTLWFRSLLQRRQIWPSSWRQTTVPSPTHKDVIANVNVRQAAQAAFNAAAPAVGVQICATATACPFLAADSSRASMSARSRAPSSGAERAEGPGGGARPSTTTSRARPRNLRLAGKEGQRKGGQRWGFGVVVRPCGGAPKCQACSGPPPPPSCRRRPSPSNLKGGGQDGRVPACSTDGAEQSRVRHSPEYGSLHAALVPSISYPRPHSANSSWHPEKPNLVTLRVGSASLCPGTGCCGAAAVLTLSVYSVREPPQPPRDTSSVPAVPTTDSDHLTCGGWDEVGAEWDRGGVGLG